MTEEKSRKLGVVVGRFQIPELHEGHVHLLDTVAKRHRQVLILLGCSNDVMDLDDPYNFEIRMLMLCGRYPLAHILPLHDSPISNEEWSQKLDRAVETVALNGEAILYGSRDSFIPKYSGKHLCEEIPEIAQVSATRVRTTLDDEPIDSFDYRKGWYDCLRAQRAQQGEQLSGKSATALVR
jgi:bifunctional NMN adenylyltransferase/nudix hydrolase